MNEALTGLIMEKEIKNAAFQMGGKKASGLYGFQGLFYHSFWELLVAKVNGVGWDIVNRVSSPQRLNSTHIVLVPKVKNPESVGAIQAYKFMQ